MTSQHSLYKHPDRKASPIQKTMSSLQVKINSFKKQKAKYEKQMFLSKSRETIIGRFLSNLYDTHQELRPKLKELFSILKKLQYKREYKKITFSQLKLIKEEVSR